MILCFLISGVQIYLGFFFLQGLHALFTGEDDTWEAWLNVDASGFSSVISLSGNGIKLRRGYSPSLSPKPTQVCTFSIFSVMHGQEKFCYYLFSHNFYILILDQIFRFLGSSAVNTTNQCFVLLVDVSMIDAWRFNSCGHQFSLKTK